METIWLINLIYLLVLLLFILAAGFCFYHLIQKLTMVQKREEVSRQSADLLDVQFEGLKLLISKYRLRFPPDTLNEIEKECLLAQKKVDEAKSKQELCEAQTVAKRWKFLLEWAKQNL